MAKPARFRVGGRNPWNLYFDRPDEAADVAVGVIYDAEFARHVADVLNGHDAKFAGTMSRHARDQMLARMPEVER